MGHAPPYAAVAALAPRKKQPATSSMQASPSPSLSPLLPPKMHMRPATTRDLHRLTEITTTSLVDDPTFDYLCPLRHEFPEDNFFFWQLKLEKFLYDKRCTVLVVEIDADADSYGNEDATAAPTVAGAGPGAGAALVDAAMKEKDPFLVASSPDLAPPSHHAATLTCATPCSGGGVTAAAAKKAIPAPTIISYGIWERLGNNDDACARFAAKNTWLNMLDHTTATLARWSTSRKYPRRDAAPARVAANAAATRTVAATYFADAGSDWWSMELLVTARAWRRRGAATALVRWGVAQADAERVFCGVEASALGAGVYARAGFRWLADWKVQVPGESEVLPFAVMRREPVVVGGGGGGGGVEGEGEIEGYGDGGEGGVREGLLRSG